MIAHPSRLFSTQIFVSIAGLLFATVANAQVQFDERSVAPLPPYCRDADTFRDRVPGRKTTQADIERWRKVMGNGFNHIHHYCWGLQLTNRALFESRTKVDRDRDLRLSIPEFDYVIRAVDSNFPLLPEILTKKGENLLRLERDPEAVLTLVRAIEVRSDYWPAYAALGDHYKEMGKVDEARSWLKRGLAASGGAKALERRLRELPPN